MLPYVIQKIRQYYGPYETKSMVCDEYGETVIFETKKGAKAYISKVEGLVYYLDHNESGRPEYKIKKWNGK